MATHTFNITGTIPDNTFDPFGSASAAQAAAIAAASTDATTKANAAHAAAISAAATDATTKANAAEAAAIAHADGLVAALGTAASVDTGTGSANVPTTAQADVRYQGKNTVVDTVVFLPPGATVWTNMPAALTFFAGQGRWVIPMGLTLKSEIKFSLFIGAAAGATNAKIRVLYRTQADGYSATITDYLTIGTSEVQVTFGGATSTLFTSAWIPLVAGAKAEVIVAIAGIDGNGAADPSFTSMYLETR